MSDDGPINANPQVKDISALPKRENKSSSENASKLPHIAFQAKITHIVTRYSFQEDFRDENGMEMDDEEGDYIDDEDEEDEEDEYIDQQEIYDLISSISDPEHPLTLGQLSVVNINDIQIRHPDIQKGVPGEITVLITPTITHCSLATLIGLGIRVRLDRSVTPVYRISVFVKKGSHQSEGQVNKQLNDKERVCAACENPQLIKVVGRMLSTC